MKNYTMTEKIDTLTKAITGKKTHKKIVAYVKQDYSMIPNITHDVLKLTFKAYRWLTFSYEHLYEVTGNTKISGGKQRVLSQNIPEQLVFQLTQWIAAYLEKNITIVRGDRAGRGVEVTRNGYTTEIGVDWHIYVDGTLRCVVECKSYLDKAFLKRAYYDFSEIKSVHKGVSSYIFSIENNISTQTEEFYLKATDTINGYFYVVDGKRNSDKPLYNPEYKKQVNIFRLCNFVAELYLTLYA